MTIQDYAELTNNDANSASELGQNVFKVLNMTNNEFQQQFSEACFPNTWSCCPGYYCPPFRACMIPCNMRGAFCPSSDTVKHNV